MLQGVKFGIGPPITNGFYYDIDFNDYDVSKINLSKIEERFLNLSRGNLEFKRSEVSKKDAVSYFKEKGDNLKLDLIKDLDDGEISFYRQGNFTCFLKNTST